MDAVRFGCEERFAKWNEIAAANLKSIESIVSTISLSPEMRAHENFILEHTKSLLISAALELAYSDCSDFRLLSQLVSVYERGHFPCGFEVERPEDFPKNASLIIF
ncbi:hypothetical protein AAFN60_21335 [Roseibacillus persicicus]|uniref:hypothetical protein n=1 Tax=Roseibacillus persicicus TaxID=454148 RepID=UPI00398B1965